MEFHLPQIPNHITEYQLKSALAATLHSPRIAGQPHGSRKLMNFSIKIVSPPKNPSGKSEMKMGWLKIPDLPTAKNFHTMESGIVVQGLFIQFEVSTRLVQEDEFVYLAAESYVSPEEEERRRKEIKAREKEARVRRLGLGQLWGDTFECEWEIEDERTGVSFKEDYQTLEVTFRTGKSDDRAIPTATTFSISYDALAGITCLAILPNSLEASIFLSLYRPPIISSRTHHPDTDEILSDRLSTLPGRSSLAPILHILLTFPSETIRKGFLDRAPISSLPSIANTTSLKILRVQIDELSRRGRESDDFEFKDFLRMVDFRIAFQVELLYRNGILNKDQIVFLKEEIEVLAQEVGIAGAEKVLDVFGQKVLSSKGAVKGLVRYGEEIWAEWVEDEEEKERLRLPLHMREFDRIEEIKDSRTKNQNFSEGAEDITLMLFLNALKAKIPDTVVESQQSGLRPGEVLTRSAIITATSYYLSGPSIDESNSILRRYPGNEHNFLRVSVREEDFTTYKERSGSSRMERSTSLSKFLNDRYLPIFTQGLQLGGRQFDFLGYSQSALHEHSAWFVTPFTTPTSPIEINAESIRSSLGDFSRVIHTPAKYMARIAQAFTATKPSVILRSSQISEVPDKEKEFIEVDDFGDEMEPKVTCFTDGVGWITEQLAMEVEASLTRGMSMAAKKRRGKPTAYQIRLGGAKGMVGINPKMYGSKIGIRPSMTKFDAPESLSLDIAESFTRARPAYLNRPLIKILEDLGILPARFVHIQRHAVEDTVQARKDPLAAGRLFKQLGIGSTIGFGASFSKLWKYYSISVLGEDTFVSDCIELAVIKSLKTLKYKSKIPVPGSYTLVGIADESPGGGYLKEGEIYACVKDPITGERTYLKGLVAISRSPTIHPGDVQLVRAVGEIVRGDAPAVSIHTNTVVFSVKGKRSLPSCLGGGDLDGDFYLLITDKNLIPRPGMICEPVSYDPVEMLTTQKPCTIKDGAEFFLKFIVSDIVGLVSNRHLVIADQAQNGTYNDDCFALADLHSRAVDFPKSGNPVLAEEMPKAHGHSKPDFLTPFGPSYQSPKALGLLFRDILPSQLDPEPSPTPADPSSKSLDPNRTLTEAIARRPLRIGDISYTLGSLKTPDYVQKELKSHLTSHSEELFKISQNNLHARRNDRHLLESELFLGIVADTSIKLDKAEKSALDKLKLQSSAHFERYRDLLLGERQTTDVEIRRAWAGWKMALEEDHRRFGVKSFAWMAMGTLLELIHGVDE